jgi:hypothetical protein
MERDLDFRYEGLATRPKIPPVTYFVTIQIANLRLQRFVVLVNGISIWTNMIDLTNAWNQGVIKYKASHTQVAFSDTSGRFTRRMPVQRSL